MSLSVLQQLLSDAERYGWASATGTSFGDLQAAVTVSSLETVRTRSTDPPVSVLEPTESKLAHPRSLSALYGTGPQPLHTDGAHLLDPPDYLLLSCEIPSAVPTYLMPVCVDGRVDGPISDLENGLFVVSTGRAKFLSPAVNAARVRYDPGCMTPADSRARYVASYFVDRLKRAETFEWNEPGLVLAVANSAVLHARGDAAGEPRRSIKRLTLRKIRLGVE